MLSNKQKMDLLIESVRSVQEPESINEGVIDRIKDFVNDARGAVGSFFDDFDFNEFAARIRNFFNGLGSNYDPIQGHLHRLYNMYLEKLGDEDDQDSIDYRLMGIFLDKDVEDYAQRNDVMDVQFLQGLVLAAIIGRGQIGNYRV